MGKYKVDAGTEVGACAGALGYCCLSAWNDVDGKACLKLSGDISPLKRAFGASPTEKWTLALGDANVPCLVI